MSSYCKIRKRNLATFQNPWGGSDLDPGIGIGGKGFIFFLLKIGVPVSLAFGRTQT